MKKTTNLILNKLNINFENSVTENPDLSIGKSGDKTEVLIDGQSGGGSSQLVVTFSGYTWRNGYYGDTATCDKTWEEINSAGRNIDLWYDGGDMLVRLNPVFDTYNAAICGTYCRDESDIDNILWQRWHILCEITQQQVRVYVDKQSSD